MAKSGGSNPPNVGSNPTRPALHFIWLTSPQKGTGYVAVNDDMIIIDCIAIWKKFIGQDVGNLIRWARVDKGVLL